MITATDSIIPSDDYASVIAIPKLHWDKTTTELCYTTMKSQEELNLSILFPEMKIVLDPFEP